MNPDRPLDTYTLKWVTEQLTELADAAHKLPSQQYNPRDTSPAQFAHAAGRARGIEDARAYVREQAVKVRRSEE